MIWYEIKMLCYEIAMLWFGVCCKRYAWNDCTRMILNKPNLCKLSICFKVSAFVISCSSFPCLLIIPTKSAALFFLRNGLGSSVMATRCIKVPHLQGKKTVYKAGYSFPTCNHIMFYSLPDMLYSLMFTCALSCHKTGLKGAPEKIWWTTVPTSLFSFRRSHSRHRNLWSTTCSHIICNVNLF